MCALIEDATRELGFRYFAVLHHASVNVTKRPLIRADNYPTGWADEFAREKLWVNDPVHLASRRVNTGFAWESIGDIIELVTEHRRIFDRSRRFGLGSGFTIPANIPGEPTASCSFVTETGVSLPAQRLRCAELIGGHAFRALRRIHGLSWRKPPHLSPRERECLRLVAVGKSDWEIARILGISVQTAHQYIKRSRAAYSVSTRTQLVVLGLRDGWLDFEDVSSW